MNRLVKLNNHHRLCNIVEENLQRKSSRFRSQEKYCELFI